MSSVAPRRRKPGGLLLAAMVAYALVLAVTPILHHDLDCHWRTPSHCGACLAAPVALGSAAAAQNASPALTDAGGVDHGATPAKDAPLPADTHGRSPPLPGR